MNQAFTANKIQVNSEVTVASSSKQGAQHFDIERREIDDDIRSSSTAIALIEAGIELFGLYGQKATTRSVAELADANIAAIPYYFRNKAGLYRACMHYVVDEIFATIGASLGSSMQSLSELNKEQAIEVYLSIMDAFCNFFLTDPATLRWSPFVMREHASPTEAYEIFYQRYYQHAQGLKAQLLAKCLNLKPSDKKIKVLNHAIFGQALGFLIARESFLRGMGQQTLSEQDIELVSNVINDNVRAIITSAI